MRPWRAGCGGTRTSGSEGGGEETGPRKRDTAPRRRPLHRKGQRYLTVVVDHDSGRLAWAAAGRDRKTVEAFFDQLGQTRCKQIELVSCDMASWIAGPVADRLPDAVRCVDPFHVVMVRHEALLVRAGCKTPTLGCRGSPVKLRTA
ncbi:MAG: transposase [Mycobacterium sp.]|nr:transposase [Mycobacterium sp.]